MPIAIAAAALVISVLSYLRARKADKRAAEAHDVVWDVAVVNSGLIRLRNLGMDTAHHVRARVRIADTIHAFKLRKVAGNSHFDHPVDEHICIMLYAQQHERSTPLIQIQTVWTGDWSLKWRTAAGSERNAADRSGQIELRPNES